MNNSAWWRHLPTIYFAQGEKTRLVKIGWSVNALGRMREIQAHSPDRLDVLGLRRGDEAEEVRLHKRFRSDRLWGEWFTCTSELLEYIADETQDIRTYFSGQGEDAPVPHLDRWLETLSRTGGWISINHFIGERGKR